jgi:hypothetical protein
MPAVSHRWERLGVCSGCKQSTSCANRAAQWVALGLLRRSPSVQQVSTQGALLVEPRVWGSPIWVAAPAVDAQLAMVWLTRLGLLWVRSACAIECRF